MFKKDEKQLLTENHDGNRNNENQVLYPRRKAAMHMSLNLIHDPKDDTLIGLVRPIRQYVLDGAI